MRRRARLLVGSALLTVLSSASALEAQTVGLLYRDDRASEGYTLFGPQSDGGVYLLHNDGLLVREWQTGLNPRSLVYLLPNGNIVRATTRSPGLGLRLEQE